MGSQFSEEFLLGYRAGHRDGFADAVLQMRDAVTAHLHTRALARREGQLAQILPIQDVAPKNGRTVKAELVAAEL